MRSGISDSTSMMMIDMIFIYLFFSVLFFCSFWVCIRHCTPHAETIQRPSKWMMLHSPRRTDDCERGHDNNRCLFILLLLFSVTFNWKIELLSLINGCRIETYREWMSGKHVTVKLELMWWDTDTKLLLMSLRWMWCNFVYTNKIIRKTCVARKNARVPGCVGVHDAAPTIVFFSGHMANKRKTQSKNFTMRNTHNGTQMKWFASSGKCAHPHT